MVRKHALEGPENVADYQEMKMWEGEEKTWLLLANLYQIRNSEPDTVALGKIKGLFLLFLFAQIRFPATKSDFIYLSPHERFCCR